MDNNIIFLDLETTGTDVQKDRIVEICLIKCDSDLQPMERRTKRINPTIPIPEGASAVHHITDDMVADAPTFAQVAKGVMEFLRGYDVAGYNSINYDVPLLYNELERAGIIWDYRGVNFIDVCNIFKIKEPRTLTAAAKFYMNEDHTEAHGAEADTEVTIQIFKSQLGTYGLNNLSFQELALMSNYDRPILDISGKFTLDAAGDIIFNFGQHKGKKAKAERSYLNWMLDKGSFSADTKAIVQQLL